MEFESYPVNDTPATVKNQAASHSIGGVTTTFDALHRPLSVTREAGSSDITSSYTYWSDTVEFDQIRFTDGRGHTTLNVFEGYGSPADHRRVSHTTAEGIETEYTYDRLGRVKTINRDGKNITYAYNSQKLLYSINRPENGLTTYTYYGNGWTNKIQNKNRDILHFYDATGALDYKEYKDNNNGSAVYVDYSYDSHGNLYQLNSNSSDGTQQSSWTYAYDEEDNLLIEQLAIDNNYYTLSYEYDALSSLSHRIYPNGRRYEYRPNGFGEPTRVKQTGSSNNEWILTGTRYYANGGIDLLNRNVGGTGHRIRFLQDAAQRAYKYTLIQNGTNNKKGDIRYFFDSNNNISKINDYLENRYSTLSYDQDNRLSNVNISNDDNWSFGYTDSDDIDWAQHGNEHFDYQYNPTSNRLQDVISNQSNRNRHYQTDSRGNIFNLEMFVGVGNNKVSRDLTFNAADRVVSLNNGMSTSHYSYDGRGLRVKKVKGGSIYSVYDNNGLLAYRDDKSTGVSSEYFYIGSSLIARRDSSTSADHTLHFLPDNLGSAVTAVNENGDLCWREAYTPYGDKTINDDVIPPSGCGIIGEERGFTAHTEDFESDLVYMQQRYYEPSLGRFLSIDPMETAPADPRTINRYTYAANNPYRFVDPDGRAFGDPNISDDLWPEDLDWSNPGGFSWRNDLYGREGSSSDAIDSNIDLQFGFDFFGPGKIAGVFGAFKSFASRIRFGYKKVSNKPPASAPTGRSGSPLENLEGTPTRNSDEIIRGRRYTGHSLDQAQNRGLTPSVVEDAIRNGTKSADPIPGRVRNYSPKNNITVITEGSDVVTVIPGKR